MDSPYIPVAERMARGGSQSDLRRHNERIVLSVIDSHPGLFNAELARRTGLAAQTISVILKSLGDRQLLTRGPVLRGRRGQPATPIFLNPLGARAYGADIGLRRTRLAGIDFSGTVIGDDDVRHPYPDPDMVIANIVSGVRTLSNIAPRHGRNRASFLGVITPEGLLDGEQLAEMPRACAAQWAQMDLRAELEAQLNMPVVLTEGGTAASGAQAHRREPDYPTDFAYIHIGEALLSGVVLHGQVHNGPGGRRPEFGALGVPHPERGLVRADQILSVGGLEAYLRDQGVGLDKYNGGDAARPGDEHIAGWIAIAAPALAHMAQAIEAVSALGAIVIDSVLPRSVLEALVNAARQRLGAPARPHGSHPALYCGTLGKQAGAVGAAREPLNRTYFWR